MAWMLITLSLACIVYSARIIMDYLDKRDDARAAIERIQREHRETERLLESEMTRRDQIREGLPGLQMTVDGLYQRLNEMRRLLLTEQDRRKRLEVAAYKMQLKLARGRT